MCRRYIGLSRIGRDRRIAITLPGTDVLVSATTYQNKRLAPIHRRVTADRLPNGKRFSRDAHGILSRVVLLSSSFRRAANRKKDNSSIRVITSHIFLIILPKLFCNFHAIISRVSWLKQRHKATELKWNVADSRQKSTTFAART